MKEPTNLFKIQKKIRKSQQKSIQTQSKIKEWGYRFLTWVYILVHELIRGDLVLRAESLSYFSLFSVMPVVTGVFLLLGYFSKIVVVEDRFQQLLLEWMSAIPEDQRRVLFETAMNYKNEQLDRISQGSGGAWFVAIGVLIWIAFRVYLNLEETLNRIWEVTQSRSLRKRLLGFLFTLLGLPLAVMGALALPPLIHLFIGGFLGVLIQQAVPGLIMIAGLGYMYHHYPNTWVTWRSALRGAFFSTCLFLFSSALLRLYFKFGTDSSYGKAGVILVAAFFAFTTWFIILLGAKVSYVNQRMERFFGVWMPRTTLAEASVLLGMIENFREQKKSVELSVVAKKLRVPLSDVEDLSAFLLSHQVIASDDSGHGNSVRYYLANNPDHPKTSQMIGEFLETEQLAHDFEVEQVLELALERVRAKK